MVLQFFKFFTKNKNEKQISLFVNNKKQNFDSIGFVNNSLVFSNKDSDTVFSIYEIKNINICKQDENTADIFEFTFVYKNNHYFVVANYKLNDLLEELKNLLKPKKILFECNKVNYNIYNIKKQIFELKEKNCTLKITKEDETTDTNTRDSNNVKNIYKYHIKIDGSDSFLVHQEEILTYNQFRSDPNERSFVWSLKHENNFYTFKIVFEENYKFLEFLSTYVSCIKGETNDDDIVDGPDNKGYYEEKRRDVTSCMYDNEKLNISSGMYDNKYMPSAFNSATENKNDISSIFEDSSSSEENETLAVGTQNKAFISRDNKINIYDTSNNRIDKRGCLEYQYTPQKIIQNDNTLIILDKENKNKIYRVDIENEKMTDVWNITDNKNDKVNDFFDSHGKFSNTNQFVAVNDNSLYQIDTRKEKIDLQNNYKTKVNFICGVSNNKGELAIGSKKGDLRLYDKLDKRAKVLLHGFGDEIYGIDTTQNGRYIICTCKNYLLLYAFDTDYKNVKEKPEAIKLQLKNEHLCYFDDVKFSTAKFSVNAMRQSIVTSTGKFLISWLLDDVVNGNLYDYSVKKCKDFVVDGDFDLASDKIIVAMRDRVKLVEKNKMKNVKRDKNE
ncbi:Vacuolar import and degradation protein 27 [Binucleata daphniae]